jgi:methionyl-tRNA formyltransferase
MVGNVLFFGRKNCKFSNELKRYLKKKSLKFYYIESYRYNQKNNYKKFFEKKIDYIFCFRSYFILKPKELIKAKKAAINFHPGPPEFRGVGCVNNAIYKGSKYYGCTAHIMDPIVDSGPIIGIKRFKIGKNDSVERVLYKTHKNLFYLAKKTIDILQKKEKNLIFLLNKYKNIKWSKKLYKKKDLEKFYEIKKNINKKRFEKILQSTITKLFKPYITIHKKKFFLE